jgi:hypothetical protein
MASTHYANLMNNAIELVVYSEGGIQLSDVENMSADELPFFIYNFKKIYTEKQTQKQEMTKSLIEFARVHIEQLFKILTGRK